MRRIFLTAAAVCALSASDVERAMAQPSAAASISAPVKACTELARVFVKPDFKFDSAAMVDATDTLPLYCEIRGTIAPEIAFVLKLPTKWNGRFYMAGNHGKAGDIDHEAINVGLKKGYAAAGTDTGHDNKKEPGALFAYNNRQKEIDFGYRAVHETAVTAKVITGIYYGNAPIFSYFVGSSTGGRQGLMEAQRYATDFNGILSGNPFVDFSCYYIAQAWHLKALLTPDSIGTGPVPLKNKILPVGKLALLDKAVYDRCDGVDGLVDGIIDDPRRCNFDPEKDLAMCRADVDAPDCFTTTQAKALKKVYGGAISNGKHICPTLAPGGETGWGGLIGAGTTRPATYTTIWDAFKYFMFMQDDPNYEFLRDFNFDTDPPKLDFMRRYFTTDDPELFPFFNNGGKLIIDHGWGDSTHLPIGSVWYYESVQNLMGPKAKDSFRLYMVPGMIGNAIELDAPGRGPGPNTFDLFAPLVNWVEKGIAPESIMASHITAGKVDRTRPLCPYPKVARYKGNGSTNDAVNFACVDPPK